MIRGFVERWLAVMGMNFRNLCVELENPPRAIQLADSKLRTKEALGRYGLPVVPTLAVVGSRYELSRLRLDVLTPSWAMKPEHGRQGSGILLAGWHGKGRWKTPSGRLLDKAAVNGHARRVLDGDFTPLSVSRERVFFEPMVRTHPALSALVPAGLSDIRVICSHSTPVLAMLRLPTGASDGRANLHRGAVGAVVELSSGTVTRASLGGRSIERHPDTGRALVGLQIPFWNEVLQISAACSPATGLGYVGVDVVVDVERGPVVLEVNARPGLAIQSVAGVGLLEALLA